MSKKFKKEDQKLEKVIQKHKKEMQKFEKWRKSQLNKEAKKFNKHYKKLESKPNISWDKKEKGWIINLNLPRIRHVLIQQRCPLCRKIIYGIRDGNPNYKDITHQEWIDLPTSEIIKKVQLKCLSCYEYFSLADYNDDELQKVLIMLIIEPLKSVHSTYYNSQLISREKGLDVKVEISKMFNFLVGGGLKRILKSSRIDIHCGQCNRKGKFTIIDAKKKILQCMECGYYNKVLFEDTK